METVLTINSSNRDLASAPSKIRSGQYNKALFDLTNWNYARPTDIVRIRCLYDLAKTEQLNAEFTHPNNPDVKDYAGRMGLFNGTEYDYPHSANPPDSFTPLTKIKSDRNDQIYKDCRRVFGYAQANTSYIDSISDVFLELADNIYYHSGQEVNSGWGYVQGQVYPRIGNICISICDVGIGVYGSYERANQINNRTEEKIVENVFTELESSLNNEKPHHRGRGLFEAKDFLNKNTGLLHIWTGNYKVNVNQTGIYVDKLEYKVEGTWITMQVPMR